MLENIEFSFFYILWIMPVVFIIIGVVMRDRGWRGLMFALTGLWGYALLFGGSLSLFQPDNSTKAIPIIGLPLSSAAPLSIADTSTVLGYVYQRNSQGVMISNPIEPDHYIKRYATVEVTRRFLLEGTSEDPYYAEIIVTFKPFSQRLLEGDDSFVSLALEEHQRSGFQWLPWERFRDNQQWYAKEEHNNDLVVIQENMFFNQATVAFQDYLGTTITQPTTEAAKQAIITSLRHDWYMPDFTLVSKSNNW
ncbi:MAG: hypothetical protein WC805_00925 [Patescibacteria group bacterium]|jgi:hypothetical protein